MTKCPYREGKKRCIWWSGGCINKEVPAEIKHECAGFLEKGGKVCQKPKT